MAGNADMNFLTRKFNGMIILFIIVISIIMVITYVYFKNNRNSFNIGSDRQVAENLQAEGPFKITFMTHTFRDDPMPNNSPVKQLLEQYTNTEIDIIWVSSKNYADRLDMILASGDLPMILYIPSKSASFVNAARNNVFWEIGKYLQNYNNLKQANKDILRNISVDGKIYGIYRSRNLGRYGIIYRKDWLRNVGIDGIKTIDDFYNALRSFTYEDPDQNGIDDTYGMVVPNYDGPFNIMSIWFGAPNGWEEDENGNLIPAHMTEGYMQCLEFWKKMYQEKLINQDFAVYDPVKWDDPYKAGKAGIKVDVCDTAGRWEAAFNDNGIKAEIGIIGAVEGPKGLRTLSTSGYEGMFSISKSAVKTEEELEKVLSFLDKLNDKEMQDLLQFGIKDRHYTLVNGEIKPLENMSYSLATEFRSANQMLMYIPPKGTPRVLTEVRKLAEKVMEENEKILVLNPAEPLVSEVYAQKGLQLDAIIRNARIKYIIGKIDKQALLEEYKLWRQSGGDDYINEINRLYRKMKSNFNLDL